MCLYNEAHVPTLNTFSGVSFPFYDSDSYLKHVFRSETSKESFLAIFISVYLSLFLFSQELSFLKELLKQKDIDKQQLKAR